MTPPPRLPRWDGGSLRPPPSHLLHVCLLLLPLHHPTSAAGLCSDSVGPPTVKQTLHDGSSPVQIIDAYNFVLPAGVIESFTLYNHGAAAPITLQAWRAVGDARTF